MFFRNLPSIGLPSRASLVAQWFRLYLQSRRPGFNPWVRKISWRRNGNPLQYPCLENPMDRGAWWATVHRVAKSRTWLKCLSMHTCLSSIVVCKLKASGTTPALVTVTSRVGLEWWVCVSCLLVVSRRMNEWCVPLPRYKALSADL